MSSATPSDWLHRMTSFEASRAGTARQAMEIIARRCGLSFWTAYRIANQTTKTPAPGVMDKIRDEYLRFCERQIKALEHEVFLLRQGDPNAALADLGDEVLRLRRRLDEAKERLQIERG